jgi:hypothetical protein
MARPSEYSPTILPVVTACATFGATKDEIANYLGVSIRCFYNWQLEHPQLVQALKRGTEASDERIVESLYQLAIGWKGSKPELGAICFWLKNRRPSEWRDVQHIDQVTGHYIISDKPMTEQEWIEARADLAKPVADLAKPVTNTLKPSSDDGSDMGTA